MKVQMGAMKGDDPGAAFTADTSATLQPRAAPCAMLRENEPGHTLPPVPGVGVRMETCANQDQTKNIFALCITLTPL